jgi:hypothetical protein
VRLFGEVDIILPEQRAETGFTTEHTESTESKESWPLRYLFPSFISVFSVNSVVKSVTVPMPIFFSEKCRCLLTRVGQPNLWEKSGIYAAC